MPLYEFVCTDCDKPFEAMKPMSRREEPEACPSCGGQGQLQMSAVAGFAGRGSEGFCASAGRPCAGATSGGGCGFSG